MGQKRTNNFSTKPKRRMFLQARRLGDIRPSDIDAERERHMKSPERPPRLRLHLKRAEVAAFEARVGFALPEATQELLRFTSGIAGGPLCRPVGR